MVSEEIFVVFLLSFQSTSNLSAKHLFCDRKSTINLQQTEETTHTNHPRISSRNMAGLEIMISQG